MRIIYMPLCRLGIEDAFPAYIVLPNVSKISTGSSSEIPLITITPFMDDIDMLDS